MKVTVPHTVFNIIKFGLVISIKEKSFIKYLFTTDFPQFKLSKSSIITMTSLIEDTINLGVISELDQREKIFPNHIFIIHQEHRTTKNRLIFDMSYLNQFISFPKFSLLKIPSILNILNNINLMQKLTFLRHIITFQFTNLLKNYLPLHLTKRNINLTTCLSD